VQRGSDRLPSVFISHSSQDSERAQRLALELEATGRCSVWLDSASIDVGENYAGAIYSAIMDAAALVVLLSEEAVHSEHVRREVGIAVSQKRPLLPVAGYGCVVHSGLPLDWRYWLETVQIHFEDDMRVAAKKIVDSIWGPVRASAREGGRAPSTTNAPEIASELKRSIVQASRGKEPFLRILQRCKRLGFTKEQVSFAVEHLAETGLIEVETPIRDGSVIRLRM